MNTKKVADLPKVRLEDLSDIEREAVLKACDVQPNAYAPLSNFKVGAAVISVNDNIYTGVNVENHIYHVVHAEVNASNEMNKAKERQFKVLICAAMAKSSGVPCGSCLQTTREWAGTDLNKTIVIGVNINDKSEVICCTFAEAMAVIDAFGPEHLDINPLEH